MPKPSERASAISPIAPTDSQIMSNWRALAAASLQDALRQEVSPLTRAAAAWEVGYVSALQVLGPGAGTRYAHPDVQVLEEVRNKLDWPDSAIQAGKWFMENRYEMFAFDTQQQERIAQKLLAWAHCMRRAAEGAQ